MGTYGSSVPLLCWDAVAVRTVWTQLFSWELYMVVAADVRGADMRGVIVVETTPYMDYDKKGGYGKCLQKVIGKSNYDKINTSGQGLKRGLKEAFSSPHLLHRLHAEI